MATDKSLNIRDIKVKEQTAADITELNRKFDELKAQLDRIEAALSAVKTEPTTKMQEASRSVTRGK
jgi:hypothetical protein